MNPFVLLLLVKGSAMDKRFATHRRMLAAAAAAVLSLVIAVGATVALGTPASGASTTTAGASTTTAAAAAARLPAGKPKPKPTTSAQTTPPVSTCTDGTAPVLFNGQWYCTGYVIGVKTGAYGTGARLVLRSVTVVQVVGTTVTVEGGPSCLPTSTYCGATTPTVTTYFTGLPTIPASGDIIDLYGITGTNTLSATGYILTGHCDPDFGC